MKVKGIPFILSGIKDEDAQGFSPGLIGTIYNGNFKGVNVNGVFGVGEENFEGVNVNGLFGAGINFSGVNVNGLLGGSGENFEGVNINGLVSVVGKELYGFSYGTLLNYAGSNGRVAIQVGGINVIREYNPDGTVIQVGGYNTAGNQAIPVLNIRGWKNLKEEEKKALEQVVDEANSDRKRESNLPSLIR